MGIFGKLDQSKIPDNPFWVEEGEYSAIVTKAFIHYNEKKDKRQLVIEYKITTPGKYKGRPVRDWFDLPPENLTQKDMEAMDEEEAAAIERANSAVLRRLCGFKQGEREFPGLGVDREDLDESWDPKVLIETEVDLAVVNSGDNNEFSNIRWVNLA